MALEKVLDWGASSATDTAAAALARAERLLAGFQTVLGHHLPNQLVAAGGLTQLLLGESAGCLESEQSAYLERLASLVRRIDRSIRALAELGRLCRDSGPAAPVPLQDAVEEVGAEVNLLSGGAVIVYHLEHILPPVRVARAALVYVLRQVLHNAAQAAVPSRPLHIEVGGRRVGEQVEIRVADNGAGLSAVVLQRLGEICPGGRGGDGLGLGLFGASLLAAHWGGWLSLSSEPAQGTTVLVRAPAAT